jgi:hypothetical protein
MPWWPKDLTLRNLDQMSSRTSAFCQLIVAWRLVSDHEKVNAPAVIETGVCSKDRHGCRIGWTRLAAFGARRASVRAITQGEAHG